MPYLSPYLFKLYMSCPSSYLFRFVHALPPFLLAYSTHIDRHIYSFHPKILDLMDLGIRTF